VKRVIDDECEDKVINRIKICLTKEKEELKRCK